MKNPLANLSARERRLALIVVALLVAGTAYLGILRASDHLALLDAGIESLEQELLHLERLAQRADTVNEAFEEIAEQHSSQWSQAEIHDRLVQEITRLAARDVPPPGEVPPKDAEKLVSIPSWPSGVLADGGEDYRTYRIELRCQPGRIEDVALFLSRLQQSSQALRLEQVELARPAQSGQVQATVTVARTIIDDEGAGSRGDGGNGEAQPAVADLMRNGGFEEWQEGLPAQWEAEGLTAEPETDVFTEGQRGLCARLEGAWGQLWQEHEAEGRQRFRLELDVRCKGSAKLGVCVAGGKGYLGRPVEVRSDGRFHRYRLLVRLPGTEGVVTFQAPHIVLEEGSDYLQVDNVSLIPLEDAG